MHSALLVTYPVGPIPLQKFCVMALGLLSCAGTISWGFIHAGNELIVLSLIACCCVINIELAFLYTGTTKFKVERSTVGFGTILHIKSRANSSSIGRTISIDIKVHYPICCTTAQGRWQMALA